MKTKICIICKIKKPIKAFYSYLANGKTLILMSYCKECHKIKNKANVKKYRETEKHRETHRIQARNYYQKNKKKLFKITKKYNKEYLIAHPWIKTYKHIMNRCYYNKNSSYCKKGIENYLTVADLKYLWFRDKAYLLKKPSIDRKNSKGNYTIKNCRYIELKANIDRASSKS